MGEAAAVSVGEERRRPRALHSHSNINDDNLHNKYKALYVLYIVDTMNNAMFKNLFAGYVRTSQLYSIPAMTAGNSSSTNNPL